MKYRSAKGILVDFDLIKIKQQIASAPPSIDVKNRQDFVEQRLRRRAKQIPKIVDVEQKLPTPDTTPSEVIEPVEPVELVEDAVPATKKTTTKKTTTKKSTTQRARKPND